MEEEILEFGGILDVLFFVHVCVCTCTRSVELKLVIFV